jgi:hypothetical protein
MSNNTLMVVNPQEVTAYAGRIRELMPGGNKLTEQEAESLAQVALLHQLSPFAKELWYLKTDDGRSLGIMAGIAGLRRASSLQLEREGGGSSWVEFDGPLPKDELKALAIPETALAFRAKLYDTRSMLAYTEACERLLKAGMPWEAVRDALGCRPYTEGVGFWTPGERTKMKPVQCAQKRAEAEARRRRFNLPFGSGVGSAQDPDAGDDGDTVEGKVTVLPGEPAASTPADRTPGGVALYGNDDDHALGDKPEPLEITPETVRVKVAALVGARQGQAANEKQVGLAQGMLAACFNTDDDQRQEMRHRVLRWLFGVKSSHELQGQHYLAILDWLHPARNEAGKYEPSEQGAFEARMVEHAALLDEGQGELFADPLIQAALNMGGRIVETGE